MPLRFLAFGRYSPCVEDRGDLPIAQPFSPEAPHLPDDLLLPLVGDLLPIDDPLPISQIPLLPNPFPSASDRDSMQLEVLQNRGSGGQKLSGNFACREVFDDVFLVQEFPIFEWFRDGKFNSFSDFWWFRIVLL